MVPFTSRTAVLGLVALLAVPAAAGAAQAASAPQPELPVSLVRIRAALKKPDGKLTASLPKSDFKVDVNEEQRFKDLLDLIVFSANPVVPDVHFPAPFPGSRTQPLVSFSGNGVISSVAGGISSARRARAERLAQEEVERALIAFCSEHECPAK
jgi:hypothetical protein